MSQTPAGQYLGGLIEPVEAPGSAPARLFVAARIGGTRLIDNMPL